MRITGYNWYRPKPGRLPGVGEHVLVAVGDYVCEAYLRASGLWVRPDGLPVPGMVSHWRRMPLAPYSKRGQKRG